MNLDRSRLLLLAAPTTPLFTGTVSAWGVAPFNLTVTPVSGAYPTDIANLLIVQRGHELARIRSRSGNILNIAETQVQFLETLTVSIYDARLPFPRYQRIVAGEVYKDYDIAFPTPWQRSMPPTVVVAANLLGNPPGEALYCATGTTIYLDASGSYGNLADAAPLGYAWTPGAGGTITGSGATVTCVYTTAGFRYLKLVVTDAHGTTSTRYIPIWVGDTHVVSGVTSANARWTVQGGWTVDLTLADPATLLQYGQAILVDADSREVLFLGFVVPNSRATTFETTTQNVTLQSALAFSRYLHAYPFLVTAVTGATSPDEWAEMYDPTLARALWYLLHWHSVLPEIVNCDSSLAPVRAIAGQEFTLGSIPQQVEAVLKSAFWQARGKRAGGFMVQTNPLYLSAANWAALVGVDLSAPANLRGQVDVEFAQPSVNQVRIGGVYRAMGGTFEPALAQAPAYPAPWGSPAEINGLAPETEIELHAWGGRHIAAENMADTYTVQPGLDIEVAEDVVADLPGGVRIALERADLRFDPQGLRWQSTVSGRAYGPSVSAVNVPIPPPIEYPPPILPPFDPPYWPPLPEPESPWPKDVWVPTLNLGVYHSDDFTDPDESDQPVWATDNSGLPNMTLSRYTLQRFGADPLDQRSQLVVVRDTGVSPATRTIYTRNLAGTWAASLTEVAAAAIASTGDALRLEDVVYDALGGSLTALYSRSPFGPLRTFRSNDNGGSWSFVGVRAQTYCYNATIYVRGNEIAVGGGLSVGGTQRPAYSSDGGATYTVQSVGNLGVSQWQASPFLLDDRFFINGNGANGPDLVEVSKADLNSHTVLFGDYDLGPLTPDSMWANPLDTLHGRILKHSQMWITRDGWATLESVAPPVYVPALSRLFVPRAPFPDVMFLAQTDPSETYPHVLYIMDGEGAARLPRAGDNPSSSPYTNSIPRTCGGLPRDPTNVGSVRGGGGLAVYG